MIYCNCYIETRYRLRKKQSVGPRLECGSVHTSAWQTSTECNIPSSLPSLRSTQYAERYVLSELDQETHS